MKVNLRKSMKKLLIQMSNRPINLMRYKLTTKLSPQLSKISCLTQGVQLRSYRRNTCNSYLVTNNLSLFFYTEDLYMDGNTQTFTLVVTIRDIRSHYLRLKTVIVQGATLKKCGHLIISSLEIIRLCCLTYLVVVNLLAKKLEQILGAITIEDLILVKENYVQ